ncbi:MAG: tRNA (adenine(22)-N(1))-methyltransferase TrmK [Calditrichaeota bacterium]|nr:tRNA (adenine(22)-N(1))-methyltransferase TrmK [Calditrichota bacterium]
MPKNDVNRKSSLAVLRNRLAAVAALIPADVRCVADIGYDHGRLIKKLVQTRPEIRAIGVELQPHYIDQFWRLNIFENEADRHRVDLRTGSGLAPLYPGEADCLVLAGIGETAIANILTADPKKLLGVSSLVLAPSRYFIKLRAVLRELGFFTAKEDLVFERGNFYHLALAQRGSDPAENSLIWHFGPRLFEAQHPGLYQFLTYLKPYLAVRMPFIEQQEPSFQVYLKQLDSAIKIARQFAEEKDKG